MQQPIRILHILASMNRGGAEAMIMNYYRHIDRSKVQFDFLLTTPGQYDYEDEIEKLGGRIFRIRPLTKKRPFAYLNDVDSFFKAHPQYKIVHSHTSSKSYFPLKIAKKYHVPVRIAHSHNSKSKTEKGIDSVIRSILRVPLKTVATKYFACGEEAALYLYGKRTAQNNTVVLANAVEAAEYAYNPDAARAVSKALHVDGCFLVGHIGRFALQKNHDFLIEIFAQIKKNHENSRLLLVGVGDLIDEIKNKVESLGLQQDVIFAGLRSDIPEVLSAMDVFVFPSLHEGLPVIMIEAQAAGIQCVISDSIPAQCIITKNVERISLEKSAEYWAEEILHYKDGYTRADMCTQIAQAGFDIKKNAKWLEAFYIDAYAEHTE